MPFVSLGIENLWTLLDKHRFGGIMFHKLQTMQVQRWHDIEGTEQHFVWPLSHGKGLRWKSGYLRWFTIDCCSSYNSNLIWHIVSCLVYSMWIQYARSSYNYNNVYISAALYGPRRKRTCLRGLANNTGTDQPTHPCSLISTLAIQCTRLKKVLKFHQSIQCSCNLFL